MGRISAREMSQRLKTVLSNNWVKNQVQEIVINDQQELKSRKKNEFEFGLLPNNKKIGQYSNTNYAYKKYSMNSLAGFGQVDLIYSGSFVNSLFVMPTQKGFIFDTNQEDKQGKLIASYGGDIMGLNQNYFNERQKEVYSKLLIKEISRVLNR